MLDNKKLLKEVKFIKYINNTKIQTLIIKYMNFREKWYKNPNII